MNDTPNLQNAARRARSKLRSTDTDNDYSDEEFEFLKAMDRYKRDYHRPNPTCCEVLAVLISLGWRKVKPEQPCEKPRDEVVPWIPRNAGDSC
jgi:hypothetical protein